jgi:hypothetical protein
MCVYEFVSLQLHYMTCRHRTKLKQLSFPKLVYQTFFSIVYTRENTWKLLQKKKATLLYINFDSFTQKLETTTHFPIYLLRFYLNMPLNEYPRSVYSLSFFRLALVTYPIRLLSYYKIKKKSLNRTPRQYLRGIYNARASTSTRCVCFQIKMFVYIKQHLRQNKNV